MAHSGASDSQSDGRRGRPGPGILHSSTQTPSPRRTLHRRRQSEATGPTGLQPQGRHHLAAAVLLGARLGASAPGHPGSPASSPGSGPRDTPPGPPTSSKRGRAPDRRPGGRRRAAGTPGRRTAQGAVAAARRACSLCAPPQNRTGLRCRDGEGRASWTDRGGTNESPFAQAPLGKCFQYTPIATRVPRARTANVRGPNGRRPGALDRRSVDVTRRPAGGGST